MYAYIKRRLKIGSRFCIFLIAAVIISVSLQFPIYAISLKDQAKEYRDKGYVAQRAGDIDKAIVFYQSAIESDPNFALVYNDLGIISEMRSDTEGAELNYLKAIELDSAYLASYSNLAYLNEKKGDLLKAALFWKKRIEKGLSSDPWTEKAKENLKRLRVISLQVNQMCLQDESVEFGKEILQKKRNEFEQRVSQAKKHFEKGEALYKQKEFARALEDFRQAKRLNPEDSRIAQAIDKVTKDLIDLKVKAYANEGLKYYQAGDIVSARNEFKKLLAVTSESSNPTGIDLTYSHKEGSKQKSK